MDATHAIAMMFIMVAGSGLLVVGFFGCVMLKAIYDMITKKQ